MPGPLGMTYRSPAFRADWISSGTVTAVSVGDPIYLPMTLFAAEMVLGCSHDVQALADGTRGRTIEQVSAPDGGDLVGRVTTLEKARKELDDAMLVHAVLEAKSAARIKEHAEFIVKHEIMMAEFDGKLSALIDILMMKREGGPEAQRG
jgi:hypothetical protein